MGEGDEGDAPGDEKKSGSWTPKDYVALLGALTAFVTALGALVQSCKASDKADTAHAKADHSVDVAEAASARAVAAASGAKRAADQLVPLASAIQRVDQRLPPAYKPSCGSPQKAVGRGYCASGPSDATALCQLVVDQNISTGDMFEDRGTKYRVEGYPEGDPRFWGVWKIDKPTCKAADCSCK